MRKQAFTSTLAVAALTIGTVFVSPPASARTFATCEALVAKYPNGVAQSSKSATRWARSGYDRPTVNKKVYQRNSNKLDTTRGVLCGTTTKEARSANANAYSELFLNGTAAQVRAGGPMVAPGSPAALYLQYWANTRDATAWREYGSRGVIQPPPAPEPVVEERTRGSAVAYLVGEARVPYTFAFDKQNRVTSWSTAAGEVAPRLYAVNGEASVDGLTVRVLEMYNTNDGRVALTATVANNRSEEAGVLYNAIYNAPNGRFPATTTSPCVKPGQTAYLYLVTEINAEGVVPSSWEVRFSADLGMCNTYSQETVLTVPVNSTP